MLDKLPAWARHLVIVLFTAALGAVVTAVQGGSTDVKVLAGAAVSAIVTQLLLWATSLTRQYGIGAPPPPGEPVIEGGQP